MLRSLATTFVIACLLPFLAPAQPTASKNLQVTVPPSATTALAPLQDAATTDQIREYLRLSGELDAYRQRWIAAVDKNRAIGAPYWPESFWVDLKAEMQKTDLVPSFITIYQHGVSQSLMQQILDTYHRVGSGHFAGTPACFRLGQAQAAIDSDVERYRLEQTRQVIEKVYAVYRPQIKAARAKYLLDHPGAANK